MAAALEDLFSLRLRLNGHRGEVQCVHASGPSLVSGGADASVRLWDLAAGRAARALLAPAADGVEGGVTAVCAGSADGPAASWVYAAVGRTILGFDLRACLEAEARLFRMMLVASDREVAAMQVGSATDLLAPLASATALLAACCAACCAAACCCCCCCCCAAAAAAAACC